MADSTDVTAGTNITAVWGNAIRKDVVLNLAVVGVDADAATITVDWSDKTKGKVRTITLGASRTLAFSNDTVGQFMTFRFIQGGAGGWSVTWPSGITWLTGDGSAPTFPTASGKIISITLQKTGSGAYDGFINGFNS